MATKAPLVIDHVYRGAKHRFFTVGSNATHGAPLETQMTMPETETLVIHSGNVGIGTSSPLAPLHVFGTIRAIEFIGDGSKLTGVQTSAGSGGLSSQWSSSNTNIYIISSNVGIGTTLPQTPLHVEGDVLATRFIGDGSLLTGLGASSWNVGATSLTTTSKLVGIGTASPLRRLHVKGDTQMDGNLYLNGNVIPSSTLENTFKNRLQINPYRFVYQVLSNQSSFSGQVVGVYGVYPYNIEVHQNGYKLSYLSSNVKDYDVAFTNTTQNTLFTVTLDEPAAYGDVIDMTIWPSFLNDNTSNLFGTAFQKVYIGGSNVGGGISESSSGNSSNAAGWSYSDPYTTTEALVGIGKTNPAFPLDVDGIINATALYVNGAPYLGSQWTTQTSNVYILSSNIGIGKTNPSTRLDVNGTIKGSAGQFSGSLTVGGDLYVTGAVLPNATANTLINKLQMNPTRFVYQVQSNQSMFAGSISGVYGIIADNLDVYLNGYKLAYISPSLKDYSVTYTPTLTTTNFAITLEEPATYGDILDIVVWPSFLDNTASNVFGTAFQNITLNGVPGVYGPWYSDSNIITANQNVGIGTTNPLYKLHINGDLYANEVYTTATYALSDMSLKENIHTIDEPTRKIFGLRGVNFTWRDSKKDGIGLIAQEVESVLPETVETLPDGKKSVAYGHIVGLLIECAKTQQNTILQMQKEIDIMKDQITNISKKM